MMGGSVEFVMNSLVGHFLILATAGGAIGAISFLAGWPAAPDREAAAIVIVPRSTGEAQISTSPPPNVPIPRDMASLTREIQRELKRVGCYDGEENGRWDKRSRTAMRAFTDQANTKPPIDRPDYVLLRLAQSHQGRACGKDAAPPPPSLLREGSVPRNSAKLD
jgi:hypothetical protein